MKSASQSINSIRILLAEMVEHEDHKSRRELCGEIINSARLTVLLLLYNNRLTELSMEFYTISYNLQAYT
jgi:hypothetical protein